MVRVWPLASLSAGLCSLAWAQDPLPTEAARREALAAARDAVRAAQQALERYGEGLRLPRPSPDELRQRAMQRLAGGRDALFGPERPAPPQPFDPEEAREELNAFRLSVRMRLHRLDPERFPRPRLPEPEVEGEGEAGARRPLPTDRTSRVVDVSDLVFAPSDHEAPAVGLESPSASADGAEPGGTLCFEDDDEDERTAGVGIEPDLLLELLEEHLGEDSEVACEYSRGRLLVRGTPEEFASVARFLDLLRAGRSGLVGLDLRLYRMPFDVFAQLRSRSGGLDAAGEALLARAEQEGTAVRLASHRVVAHDGQRVVVHRGTARTYVGDVEVDCTGVVPVTNPVPVVLNEGLVVEARPLVDRAHGRVLVDLALSLARSHADSERRKVGGLELELPTLDIVRGAVTAVVPLGRGALLGGSLAAPGDALASVVYVRPRLLLRRHR